jgi:PAS domain-containing protein
MFSGSQVFLLLSVLLPPVFLLFLFRRLRENQEKLKAELRESKLAAISSEEALQEILQQERKSRLLLQEAETKLQNLNASWRFSEIMSDSTDLIYLQVDNQGQILAINSFTRNILGLASPDGSSVLNILDWISSRQLAILISRSRQTNFENSGKTFAFSFVNRYDEKHQLHINLFPLEMQKGMLVLGHRISGIPGFGPERHRPIFEAALHSSKWPAVLLEKSSRSNGIRKSRIVWASASAARILGFESHRVIGLPLEVVSKSLAASLNRMISFGDENPLWQADSDSSELTFRILVHSTGNFFLVQLLPSEEFSMTSSRPESGLITVASQVNEALPVLNFSRLMEITEGDPGFLKELLPSYLSALQECRTQFRRGLDDGSLEKIRFLHHKIKATIRTFGLSDLEEIFQEAIHYIKTGRPEDDAESTRLMARLSSVCLATENAIRKFALMQNLYI